MLHRCSFNIGIPLLARLTVAEFNLSRFTFKIFQLVCEKVCFILARVCAEAIFIIYEVE